MSADRPPRGRRGLTRWEVAVGLALLAGLAAWGSDVVRRLTLRSRRAEVPAVLIALADAARIAHRETDAWPAVPSFPRGPGGVGADAVRWPDPPVLEAFVPPVPRARGAYRLEPLADGGARLVGLCDVDGDGVPAQWELVLPDGPPRRLTPASVH